MAHFRGKDLDALAAKEGAKLRAGSGFGLKQALEEAMRAAKSEAPGSRQRRERARELKQLAPGYQAAEDKEAYLKEKEREAELKAFNRKLKGYERKGKLENVPTKLAYEAQYHQEQEKSRADATAKLNLMK